MFAGASEAHGESQCAHGQHRPRLAGDDGVGGRDLLVVHGVGPSCFSTVFTVAARAHSEHPSVVHAGAIRKDDGNAGAIVLSN